jgi:predicted RND superfamily exporter protein
MKNKEISSSPIRWLFFLLTAVLFLFIVRGSFLGRKDMKNRVIDWLPSGFRETQELDWFLAHFREGELLMVSWEGCTPEDPKLKQVAQRLLEPEPLATENFRAQDTHTRSGAQAKNNSDAGGPYYWKVMTTGDILHRLTDSPLNLSREEAEDRMRGWIISKDFRQGCLVAFLSEEGFRDNHAAIRVIRQVTREITGLPTDQIHIAGVSLDSVVIDETTERSQARLMPIFLGVCVLILYFLLRSWRAVLLIFMVAIFNEELSAALIYYAGANTDSISLLSASLLYVLTISGTLHLLNYYRDSMEKSGQEGAVYGALQKGVLPCGLACLTTVMGLISLGVSQVIPIRNFGVFASNAMIIGTNFFIFFSALFLEEFPIKKWLKKNEAGVVPQARKIAFWNKFSTGVIRFHLPLTCLNIFLLVFFACYLPRLDTVVTFHGMFPKDAPILLDYDYLEDRIGGLIPVEVVLNIPDASNPERDPLPALRLLEEVEWNLSQTDEVDSSLSALSFLPLLPDQESTGLRSAGARRAFNNVVASRLDLLREGCLYDDRILPEDERLDMPSAQRWRISLRVPAKLRVAYGPFLEKLRTIAEKTIAEKEESFGLHGVTTLITGGVPVVHKAQRQLLSDLSNSYVSAFALILIALVFLLRGIRAGGIAMIPNIFPSVVIFGAMASLARPIDMGTMMTASVALGISVDGTIHFVTWFKRGMRDGLTRLEAIQYGYRECATAMSQTMIICGGGMLVFASSEFLPIARFAWVMAILLFTSLYGNLVLFPALLAGPFGKLFIPKQAKEKI